jgi:hypothetical protein
MESQLRARACVIKHYELELVFMAMRRFRDGVSFDVCWMQQVDSRGGYPWFC